jgi:hypothetical protein
MIKPISECGTGEGFDVAIRITRNYTSTTDYQQLADFIHILKSVKQCYIAEIGDIPNVELSATNNLYVHKDMKAWESQLENTVIFRIRLSGYSGANVIYFANLSDLPIQTQRKIRLAELV